MPEAVPLKKKFRSIPFSEKLRKNGFDKPKKGYTYQKFPGREFYRQVSVKTGLTLKNKRGQTRIYGTFGDKQASARHWDDKYPQFKIFREGTEKHEYDSSISLARKNAKARKQGKTKFVLHHPVHIKPGKEWVEAPHPPQVISKSVRWVEKGKVKEVELSRLKKFPAAKVKLVYRFADGSTQASGKYEKRLPQEIKLFKAASEKGKGSIYRPGTTGKTNPVFHGQVDLGPGRQIDSTRKLVNSIVGKRTFKGNLKLAFDWKVFEGMGKAGELQGKSGGGFKFNAPKASKAFMAQYRRYVKEHLVDALVAKNPKLRKYSADETIKRAKLTRGKRDRIIRDLKKQGLVPQSALSLFFEMKIAEAAKLRGVIVSAGKAFKDFKKAGLRSAKDEGWSSQFQLNLYKEAK